MKMKRKNCKCPINFADRLKKTIFFSILLLGLSAQAQQANIEVVNNPAMEQGQVPGRFRVFLTGVIIISIDRTINYTVGGTSGAGDYAALPGQVFIPAGSLEAFIDVTGINDDNLVEGDETIEVTLTAGFNYTLPPIADRTKSITLLDNDTAVISMDTIGPEYRPETNEAGGQTGQFRVQMTQSKDAPLDFDLNISITGTATIDNGMDFTLTGAIDGTGTIIPFPAGQQIQFRNINVVPLDDLDPEDDETVIMTLVSTSRPDLFTIDPANNTATVTIIDDDCAAGASPPARNSNPSDLCDAASLNLNSLIVGGAGSAPAGSALRWSLVANPTAENQLLANPTVTTSDTYYGLYWDSDDLCGSPSTAIEVNFNTSPEAGTPVAGLTRCNDNTFGPTSIDLDNAITGQDGGGTWSFVSGPANVPFNNNNVVNFNGDPLGTYVYRYTVVGVAPCGNDLVDATIVVEDCDPCVAGDDAPALNGNIPMNFCDEIAQSLNDYTSSTPPNGTELRWSTDSDLENESAHLNTSQIANPLPGTYYGFFWDDINSCASPALVVNLVVNTTPTITATSGDERCGPGSVTLTATVTGNPTINWYNAETGGSIVGNGANFTPNVGQTTSYWVEATENDCATSPRIEVVATVIPQPSAGTPSDGSSCSDPTYGETVLNLNNQLEGEDEGAWVVTSQPAGGSVQSGFNEIDFIGQPDGDYVFTYTTTGAMAPCENESSVVTISISNCDTDDDMDGLLGGYEASIGTDPNNPDTDEDGVIDGDEIGDDQENPLDEDNDGIIDALDSNVADTDNDGVVDQKDPANTDPCIPERLNGQCDYDGDGISDPDEVANGSDPDDPCSPNATPNCDSPVDLEILKTVDNEDAVLGDRVTFTITVNNFDDRKVRNIKIGDFLENGFAYVEHIPASANYDWETTGEWLISELPALGSTSLQIVVDIVEGDGYTNTATLLDSFPIDGNEINNEATAEINVDLPEGVDLEVLKWARIKADPDTNNSLIDEIRPLDGQQIVFVVRVTNRSTDGTDITNIQIEDILPDLGQQWFSYISHDIIANDISVDEYNPQTGIWKIPTLMLGQEATLEITGMVQLLDNTSQEETYTNTARLVRSSPADGNPENNEDSVNVRISKPNEADVGFLFNQFSPNADGTNDVLEINLVDPETQQELGINYNVKIFNRYGNLVFEGDNMTEAEVWDGSWKGKEAPDGTYFYIMSIVVGDDESAQTKKGWIQLIR